MSTVTKKILGRLDDFWRGHRKLSVENAVPEAAGNAEPVLVVGKVVRQVVLLQVLVVRWKAARNVSVKHLKSKEEWCTYFLWWRK